MYSVDHFGKNVKVEDTASSMHYSLITKFSFLSPVDFNAAFVVTGSTLTLQDYTYVGTLYSADGTVFGENGTVYASIEFNNQRAVLSKRYKAVQVGKDPKDVAWIVL